MEKIGFPLNIRKSRWRFALPLVGSLMVLGICLYFLADREPSGLIWTLIVIFGVSSLACFFRMMDAQPGLVISEIGVCDTNWSVGTIPWKELHGAFIKSDGGVDYICLTLRHPEQYRREMGKVGRVISSATRQTGFGDFTMRPSAMGLDTSGVFEIVKEQLRLSKGNASNARPEQTKE